MEETRKTPTNKKANGVETRTGGKKLIDKANTPQIQATWGQKTGNHGAKEREDCKENAKEMENPSTQKMTGALPTDKEKTGQDQKQTQPGDSAKNAPTDEKTIDGAIQNLP